MSDFRPYAPSEYQPVVIGTEAGSASILNLLLRKLSSLWFIPSSLGPALNTNIASGSITTVTTVTTVATVTTLGALASVSYAQFSSMGYSQMLANQAYQQGYRRNLVHS